jgi:L,D-transpeptidase ErfK/SrfK
LYPCAHAEKRRRADDPQNLAEGRAAGIHRRQRFGCCGAGSARACNAGLDRSGHQRTKNGAILCDTKSRALHFWSEDQSIYKLYPTSVPLSEDLTRLGKTEVVQKVVNPPWRPTASMRERHPEWPEFVEGGSPENPLGVRALYLSWPAYRIHGTHDTRKIGRRSSNGCIGLYNEHIIQLFDLSKVGTQVLLI